MGDEDGDGEMQQIGHVGQGLHHESPDSSQAENMDAKTENKNPECYETAFLFTSVEEEAAFTSDYGTVQNLKIQYGKFPNYHITKCNIIDIVTIADSMLIS